MLTQDQKNQFRLALASWNACGSSEVEADDFIEDFLVAETSDTLENFFLFRGKVSPEKTAFGEIYVWRDVQARKGARRGNLFVMHFDNARAAYFDGEA